MRAHRPVLLATLLLVLLPLAAGAQPPDSARSAPPDTTPYWRPVVPQDLDPFGDGRGAFSFTAPFMVDVVINNTDAALINTDLANDGETSLAVNPENPNEILITSFTSSWGANTAWWHSTDGGQTWTKRFTIPAPPGQPGALGCPCDQAIDFGRSGRVFGTFLADQLYTGGSTGAASAANWSWHAPGGVTQPTNFGALNNPDQPWLLVNRDPVTAAQDNAYVAYDDFNVSPVGMRVAVATGTFPPVFIRDNPTGTAGGAINPGHRMTVDPRNGWVYDLWQKCIINCATLASDPKTIEYRLNRSRDGGQTWDFPAGMVVATGTSTQPEPKFGTVNALLGGVLHAAVDPRNGDLYYVYGNSGGFGNRNRLAVRRLTTDAAMVISIGAEHFVSGGNRAIPSVAVADNGVIGVFNYSFDGPADAAAGGFPIFTAHVTLSDNQGTTWNDRTLMTFLSSALDSCPSVNCTRQRVLGDYMQMKAVGNVFYGAFTANGAPFGRPIANHDPIFFKIAATVAAELDVVVRGTDNGIYRNHFLGGWEGWQFLGGFTLDTPAVVARAGGAFDVVVRGTDSGIYHGRFDGVSFSGFSPVGGLTPEAPVVVQGNYRATVAGTSAPIVPGTTRIDGTGCDDCFFQLALPFPVRFYGAAHQGLLVSSNGTVQFQGSASPDSYDNVPLPTPEFEKAILLLWDDLRTDVAGKGIFTATVGSAPNRQFVIEWRAEFYDFPGSSVNFEIVFSENSPTITVIYGAYSGAGTSDNGGGATAGVQLRSVGPRFTQFSHNQAILLPGLRIDYVPADLELVVRGTDNGVYHNTFDGAAWTGWTFVGGFTLNRPALVSVPNGGLELVVRGTDSGIYHNRFNGTTWTGFVNIPGLTNDAPALAATATTLDLVVRGVDSGIYHNRFPFAAPAWAGFVAVGGATVHTPALVASGIGTQLDLVLRGSDSGIYHNHFDGTAWTGYVPLTGFTLARPALTANQVPGVLDLVVRGIDGSIYHAHYDGTSWSGFVGLGGLMLSEPALVTP
jgi:hypothetical protein